MSTLSVSTITDASGGNTATINGQTPTESNMAGRNRIINGDMRIDARNAGASVTPTTNGQYGSCDRWNYFISQASKFSVQQNAGAVTPPAGFTNYLGVTSLSAYSVLSGDAFVVRQGIEGFNVADLGWGTANAQTVTLSFWVRSSLTGAFGGSFYNGTATRSYPFTYTVSAANTWEQKTITVSGDTTGTWATDNTEGVNVRFSLGAGATFSGTAGAWAAGNIAQPTGSVSVVGTSGATFYLTGVQLESGSVATLFERRQYGQELALCQRYYWQQTAAEQGNKYFSFGGAQSSSSIQTMIAMPVAMRANPTITAASFQATGFGATPTAISGTTFNGNSLRVGLSVSGATAYTVGNVGFDVTLSSEL